jgi:hypothetical protein
MAELPPDDNIESVSACTVIVNARVQTDPAKLYAMMSVAMTSGSISVQTVNASFFKPGYPRPTHRIQD